MAGFELQGTTASSCEPFSKWCHSNGVDLRASTAVDDNTMYMRDVWNELLRATEAGDTTSSERLIGILNTVEDTPGQQ